MCVHGVQEGEYHKSNDIKDIYPDFVMMAQSFGIPSKRVIQKEDLRAAVRYTSPVLSLISCLTHKLFTSIGRLLDR